MHFQELVTNTFTHNRNSYRVTAFRGGKLEVYKNEDGLEMFQGYLHQVNIDLAEAAYDAFHQAKGQLMLRWA